MRPPAVSCEGAPRDLGYDQGAFARHGVATALRGLPRPGWLDRLVPDPHELEVRLGRDLRRYYPHLFERTIGLARGAHVSQRALWALLGRHAEAESGATVAAAGAPGSVLRAIDRPPADLLLRRSAPGEGDFRSIEIALPGIVPALIGVNEHGLVVSASWTAAVPGLEGPRACSAPAPLLAQDCLQRFDSVAPALEWCERRPAGGPTTIVLADAGGELAAIHVVGAERRVVLPDGGLLIAPQNGERALRLAKAAATEPRRDGAALGRILDLGGVAGGLRVLSQAGRPSLAICGSGRAPAWIDL